MQDLVPYFVGTSASTVETSCGSGVERCAAGKASAAAVAAGRYGCTSVCSGSMPLVEASKLPAPTRDKTCTKTCEEAAKVPAPTSGGGGSEGPLSCAATTELCEIERTFLKSAVSLCSAAETLLIAAERAGFVADRFRRGLPRFGAGAEGAESRAAEADRAEGSWIPRCSFVSLPRVGSLAGENCFLVGGGRCPAGWL